MQTKPVNLADPRVEHTHVIIRRTFERMFYDRPFRDITVQDIAREAKVHRATFYAHFESKESVVEEITRQCYRQLVAAKRKTSNYDGLAPIIEATLVYLGRVVDGSLLGNVGLPGLVDQVIREELHTVLVEWLRERSPFEINPWVSRATIATALTWEIFGLGVEWRSDPRAQTAAKVAGDLTALVGNGLFSSRPSRPQLAQAPSRNLET